MSFVTSVIFERVWNVLCVYRDWRRNDCVASLIAHEDLSQTWAAKHFAHSTVKDQPQTLHFPPEASGYSRLGAVQRIWNL